MRLRFNELLGFEPMSHRPPLPTRWWLYCVLAFLAPPILLQLIPPEDVAYRDLVWLITLVPAYILSLQFGLHGAAAGLGMGTILYLSVQFIDALDLSGGDWRITVPCYVAYSAIAISVGWLSQELHGYYGRALAGERATVVRQLAVTMQHEVRNALSVIRAEAELMERTGPAVHIDEHLAAGHIRAMADRIDDSVERLANLSDVPVTDYLPGISMIDLDELRARETAEPAVTA